MKDGCFNTTVVSGCGKMGRFAIGMVLPKNL
jgi:hypothetical protein